MSKRADFKWLVVQLCLDLVPGALHKWSCVSLIFLFVVVFNFPSTDLCVTANGTHHYSLRAPVFHKDIYVIIRAHTSQESYYKMKSAVYKMHSLKAHCDPSVYHVHG